MLQLISRLSRQRQLRTDVPSRYLQPHLLFELLHESVLLPFQQRHLVLRLLLLR